MTYCVAVRLDSGIMLASDSRTNAGVDHIMTFSKMRVYEKPDDRVIVLLSSGNLAITQGAVNMLDRQRHASEGTRTMWTVDSMVDVAQIAGGALRDVEQRDGNMLVQSGIDASADLIVGGQIRGEEPRLFHVYQQGNFIEECRHALFPARRVQVRQADPRSRADTADALPRGGQMRADIVRLDAALQHLGRLAPRHPLVREGFAACRRPAQDPRRRSRTGRCCARAGAAACARCSWRWTTPTGWNRHSAPSWRAQRAVIARAARSCRRPTHTADHSRIRGSGWRLDMAAPLGMTHRKRAHDDPRRAASPHALRVRSTGLAVAARNPLASGRALAYADRRAIRSTSLRSAISSTGSRIRTATGSRASSFGADTRACDRRRSRCRPDRHQPVRFLHRQERRAISRSRTPRSSAASSRCTSRRKRPVPGSPTGLRRCESGCSHRRSPRSTSSSA